MEKVRLGIIGVGAQGSVYANFLQEKRVKHMTLGALCDVDPEVITRYKENYSGVPFYNNYKEMIKSGNVDAVITCVPHYLHPEIGIFALENGVHALIEKPAGIYAKEVRELNHVADSKPDLTFGIMFNQRTNKLYQHIKNIIDNGEIGNIRRTNWLITSWWRPQAYYDGSEWRATWNGEGGGVLVNQAPHQLDLLQWICGMPKKVFANLQYGFQRDITVEDDMTVVFDYGDGATGVFISCTHDMMGTDRLEILGDKGKIIVENSNNVLIKRLIQGEQEINSSIGPEDVTAIVQGKDLSTYYEEEELEFESVWGEQHIAVLENFAANIVNGEPLLSPGSDGINGVELANAIHLSSWLEKQVSLPVDEELFSTELNKKMEEEKQKRK